MTKNGLLPGQRSGQRLMVGFDGIEMNDELKHLIGHIGVGGIILFSRNIISKDQVTHLCTDIQACAREHDIPPLFVAIDQEGGQVARLKAPFTEFPGNPYMTSVDDAIRFAQITARELKEIGVNMNLAPVMDVVLPGLDGVMINRVFGSDPEWVAQMGSVVIDHLQKNNMMAVAKHFPGIGRTVLDSHQDLPTLETDLPDLESSDLIPFSAAIRQDVSGIMLSHILYTALDPEWPASLSVSIARDLLRQKMGYTGLVMTDDLDMGAITKHYDLSRAVDQVILAEIDLILICNSGPSIDTAADMLRRCERNQPDLSERAINRILGVKADWI
ncbi:MAG: beta-N-acetylhexosaminidase [Desulfatirhabdiaceae bacterium]